MNRKISVGMMVTIVILAITVTFSITMLLAMRLFDSTAPDAGTKVNWASSTIRTPSMGRLTRSSWLLVGEV